MAKSSSNQIDKITESSKRFADEFEPFEVTSAGTEPRLFVLVDGRTGAHYCDCHVKANKLVALATIDVPLDPEEQAEYRANREIVADAYAFQRMQDDAVLRRTFSNIVTEYTHEFDPAHPLKIIGGQHRFEAIRRAFEQGVDEYHGLEVYLGLNKDQRLDVQLISNTNIAISGDLFDRMQETVKGPELRNWCQAVGFLDPGRDFTDSRVRGGPMSVQVARTFISNYYLGRQIDAKKFAEVDTTPTLSQRGQHDEQWDKLRSEKSDLWKDEGLRRAATQFSTLAKAQRDAFGGQGKGRVPSDFPDKAMNLAVISAWAYVAGLLAGNEVRLKRHFALAATSGRDPLNAPVLAKGRHRTDPENYRGLGYRTDPKERGRFVELFFVQAESGSGVTKSTVDLAIAQYHAKQAQLEVARAKARAANG